MEAAGTEKSDFSLIERATRPHRAPLAGSWHWVTSTSVRHVACKIGLHRRESLKTSIFFLLFSPFSFFPRKLHLRIRARVKSCGDTQLSVADKLKNVLSFGLLREKDGFTGMQRSQCKFCCIFCLIILLINVL